jgi:hypothetical protein
MLGVSATSVILWPMALAGGFVFGVVGGGVGLEKRIKSKACEQSDELLAGMPRAVHPKISDKLGEVFDQLETTVTKEISDVIEEEERHIRENVELNQREQADRDRVVANLNETASAVAAHRLAIQRALTIARQTL